MMCKKLNMLPIECIVRGYITGSGWAELQRERNCLRNQTSGRTDRNQTNCLNRFTHHPQKQRSVIMMRIFLLNRVSIIWKNISREEEKNYAEKLRDNTIALYKKCAEYALSKGIIIADTKFEFGLDEERQHGDR